MQKFYILILAIGEQSHQCDPGVPLVYTSFAVILIGGSLSIISTKKIWVLHEKEKSLIYIGCVSNRNLSGLSKELPKFISFLDN